MLIVIISLCLFVICLVVFIVSYVIEEVTWRNVPTSLILTALLLSIIFGFVSLVSGGIAIETQVTKDVEYEQKLYEKQILEYRLENCEDLYGNELLYADITKFNNELRNTKHWANNLWTSWFYNDKVATIDYIEIGNIGKGD